MAHLQKVTHSHSNQDEEGAQVLDRTKTSQRKEQETLEEGQQSGTWIGDELTQKLKGAFPEIQVSLGESRRTDDASKMNDSTVKELISAKATWLGYGLNTLMGWSDAHVGSWLKDPVDAVVKEWEAARAEDLATDLDMECLNYVLREKAGSNNRVWAHNKLKMDHDYDDQGNETKTFYGQLGVTLEQLAGMDQITKFGLEIQHVLVLRLYSTAAYKTLNKHLRSRISSSPEQGRTLQKQEGRANKYPFPMTASLIKDAILKLRTSHMRTGSAVQAKDFYRGLTDVSLPEEFLQSGGCELAPCSSSVDLMVQSLPFALVLCVCAR